MNRLVEYAKKSVIYLILIAITLPIILLYYYLFVSSFSEDVMASYPRSSR